MAQAAVLSGLGFALVFAYVRSKRIARAFNVSHTTALPDGETARFANLVLNLPGVVYRCALDEHWTMNFISDEIEHLTGYPPQDFLKNKVRTYASLIHPEDLEAVDKTVREAVKAERPFALEYRIITKDGKIRWVMERGRAYIPQDPREELYIDGVILDNTDRMQVRQDFLEQQEFVRKVTELSPELIFVFSSVEGRMVFVNDKVQQIFGYSKTVFCSLPLKFLADLVHPEDSEAVGIFYRRVKNLGSDQVIEHEHRMRRVCGTYIWVRHRVSVFRRDCFDQPIEMLNILEDITEQKQTMHELEQQRLNASYVAKMASLGEMAGGIAHEINNPLAIILARAKQMEILLRREPLEIERLAESLQSMMHTSERITTIIRGLRSFARDGSQDPLIPTTLEQILEETISLCESRMIELNIELRLGLGEEKSIPVLARPVQISQICLNLINNAIDAIQGTPKAWIRIETFQKDKYLGLRVVDSGSGIPLALREKIMMPFFTTKTSGRGTGLGLSISRTIAVSHGGDLSYEPDASNTSFALHLPKMQDIKEDRRHDQGQGLGS